MPAAPGTISREAWDVLVSPARWRLGHLSVDRAETLRYLGYAGQALEPDLSARIDAAITDVEQLVPTGVSAAFAMRSEDAGAEAGRRPCIRLADTAIALTGNDIYQHLKGASLVVVLAVTLGLESERRLQLLGSQRPLEASVYDAACSALVEQAADAIDDAIKREAARFGLAGNQRFSCGYGDLPLDAQGSLLDALDARRALGITLTPSNLMVPSKSITAVFGLFPVDTDAGAPVPNARTARSCQGCAAAAGCPFRTRNTPCWS